MTGRRLTALVFLAACSMVLQYAAQGALAAGFNPREFGAWFWYADAVLWGLRALIDAAVIVSLFQTIRKQTMLGRALRPVLGTRFCPSNSKKCFRFSVL